MDTVGFLNKILPDEGLVVLAEFRGGAMRRQHFYNTIEEAATAVAELDAKGEVYHGCATYKTNENRKHSNVSKAKCFWLDIDVGKNDGYETQAIAAQQIAEFCKEVKLHAPMIISSGRGLHVYWLFSNAVDAAIWKTGANLFRQALDTFGFKHDPSRTTDQSSILRPVGSHWRKDGAVEVKALCDSTPKDFDAYITKFEDYVTSKGEMPKLSVGSIFPIIPIERLGVEREYPPSSAHRIAGMCNQIAKMRDFKGAVSEPEWRNAIGVLKHTVEGYEICHEWSTGDARYDRDQTQEKIDRWEAGPTTCEQFERTNSALCSSCRFKGKAKSPISLGYVEEVEAPKVIEESYEAVEAVKNEPDYMMFWPKGFQWIEGDEKLTVLRKDEDGMTAWVSFANAMFYPTTRIELEDGTWAQRIRMRVHENRWREFDLPSKLLASTEALCAALAAQEILIEPKKGAYAVKYLGDWQTNYRKAAIEMSLHKKFGWHDNYDTFLIGDNKIELKTGEVKKVLLSTDVRGEARKRLVGDSMEGSAEEWARLFNECYNRPNIEPYQFAAMALLSAPIVGLVGAQGWHGIPIALTGEGGQGKTTLARSACSAYGKPDGFMFDARNATMTAFDPIIATLNHLPVLMDELTGADPKPVSGKLYALSNGGGRVRADVTGQLSLVDHKWDTISMVTGNTNINESMAELSKTQADATQVRVFEYMVPKMYAESRFKGTNVRELSDLLMTRHYGCAGYNALRVMHKEKAHIREAFEKLRNKHGFQSENYDSKERFFIDLIVTAIIGGKIFSSLGYIKWDVNNVRDWALNHILEMRNMRIEALYTSTDRLAQFLGSLNGHMLVTKRYSKGSPTESPMDSYRIVGDVRARMALDDRRFVVAHSAFEEFCREKKVSSGALRNELTQEGYILTDAPARQYLTSGTIYPSAQQRVIEFVYDEVLQRAQPKGTANVIEMRAAGA